MICDLRSKPRTERVASCELQARKVAQLTQLREKSEPKRKPLLSLRCSWALQTRTTNSIDAIPFKRTTHLSKNLNSNSMLRLIRNLSLSLSPSLSLRRKRKRRLLVERRRRKKASARSSAQLCSAQLTRVCPNLPELSCARLNENERRQQIDIIS